MNFTLPDIKNNIDVFTGVIKKYNIYSDCVSEETLDTGECMDMAYYKSLYDKFHMSRLVSSNDLTTCFNVLRWVHEQMLFKNTGTYNGKLETGDILDYCRAKHVILNCALHSIVLTELLISVGIPCRSIQCLPFDPLDNDSHFINHAFIKSLNEWIAVDPSYATYFLDGQGKYMNLQNIRQCVAEGISFNVNRAVRFKDISFDFECYQAYLIKNLFRFSRIGSLKFSHKNNVIYYLEPLGYRTDSSNRKRVGVTEVFLTDESKFWE